MTEESSQNSEQPNSKKYWLRALIIIAIGIPVLIELMTLFNLVTVQFWGKEEEDAGQTEATTEIREFMQGDTLYSDPPFILTLRGARVEVSPNQWVFLLSMAADSTAIPTYQIQVDSLGLGSGEVIGGKVPSKWEVAGDTSSTYQQISESWEIPNGDIPDRLFLTLQKSAGQDSVKQAQKVIHLGPVPIRYQNQ